MVHDSRIWGIDPALIVLQLVSRHEIRDRHLPNCTYARACAPKQTPTISFLPSSQEVIHHLLIKCTSTKRTLNESQTHSRQKLIQEKYDKDVKYMRTNSTIVHESIPSPYLS